MSRVEELRALHGDRDPVDDATGDKSAKKTTGKKATQNNGGGSTLKVTAVSGQRPKKLTCTVIP